MVKAKFRRIPGAPGRMRIVRNCFQKVPDPFTGRKRSLPDYLMSGLAIFH